MNYITVQKLPTFKERLAFSKPDRSRDPKGPLADLFGNFEFFIQPSTLPAMKKPGIARLSVQTICIQSSIRFSGHL